MSSHELLLAGIGLAAVLLLFVAVLTFVVVGAAALWILSRRVRQLLDGQADMRRWAHRHIEDYEADATDIHNRLIEVESHADEVRDVMWPQRDAPVVDTVTADVVSAGAP